MTSILQKVQKNDVGQFVCEKCDYSTIRKSQILRHLGTLKHSVLNQDDILNDAQPNMECDDKTVALTKYQCQCGKKYSYRQGIWKHKTLCEVSKKMDFGVGDGVSDSSKKTKMKMDLIDKKFFLKMLKDNQEFKELIMEQNKKLIEMVAVEKSVVINNNTNCNNNINHNKQFNLQFFLNETCKNAMNINEFVDSLEIKSCELEDFGKLGYIQGISNIFIRGLKELDETERPLHCTDKKREILYIKHNNIWEKDSDKEKMIKTIKDIANKNFKRIPKWKQDNPLSEDNSTKKHMEYMHILNQVMTGITPDDEVGINKIIKKIAKTVYIDKNM